jgi:hypothetical protein
MKRLFRTGMILSLLALILVAVPGAFAQEPTFGLSDADYELFTTANSTSAAFDDVALDFTLSLTAAGLADEDVTANLTGSAAIATSGLFSLTVGGEVNDGTTATPVNLEVRVVENMLYVNVGDENGWQGGPLDQIASGLTGAFTQGMGGALPVDPEALAGGDLSGMMGNEDMMSAMSALSTLDPESFIAITRSDADGLAQYNIALSIADLLQDPAIASLMGSQMGGGQEMTAEQQQQMGMMMSMMFSNAVVSLDQYVDQGTNLVERAVLTFSLPLDMMVGPGAAIDLSFDIDITGYNQGVTVEAPAEFTELNMG